MLTKDEIVKVLADWNIWTADIETGIPRTEYLDRLKRAIGSGEIVTIIGIRRAGKSTIMKQCMKDLVRTGVPRNNLLYVNFEDPRFEGELSLPFLTRIYEAYMENMKPTGKPYLFLDEIQEVEGWEKFVRSVHERKEATMVISGSSSSLLDSELSTLLTGRHLDIKVLPLGFLEYLAFRGLNTNDKTYLLANRLVISGMFNDYRENGGFPATLPSGNKELLQNYFRDIISKDVVRRYRLREIDKINVLAKYYVTNTASPTTFNSIRKFLGIPIETVGRFSTYLEAAYLVFFVKRFSHSMKEQEKSPRKVYAIDTGLRNAVSLRFQSDIGKLVETIVFLELLRRGLDISYWKDKEQHEVDFVIREGISPTELIQVCWNLEDPKTKKRELAALVRAAKDLKLKSGTIITNETEGNEVKDGITIRYIPFLAFMLGSQNFISN